MQRNGTANPNFTTVFPMIDTMIDTYDDTIQCKTIHTMQYINLNKGTATPDFTTIFPQIQWIYVKWIQMNTNRNMNTKTNSQMCLQMIVANVCFQCCIKPIYRNRKMQYMQMQAKFN